MSSFAATALVLATWMLPFFAMLGSVFLARCIYHRRDRRNPLSRDLLRGPGHSLRERREDAMTDLMAYASIGPVLPLLLLALYLAQRDHVSTVLGWSYVVVGVAAMGFCVYKLAMTVKALRSIGLGLEAETAVGQELDWLMRDGFAVFHDVPGDGPFNVDHVVVGPQGVFAIETKGRAKPVREGQADGHRVQYDGNRLIFPGWTETAPLDQAKRNAEWLSKWLGSAVGTSVEVRPVVMLPGWFVERTSPPSIAVLNGKNSGPFFLKARSAALSEQLIKQIIHQLDARCRDVAPRSYRH